MKSLNDAMGADFNWANNSSSGSLSSSEAFKFSFTGADIRSTVYWAHDGRLTQDAEHIPPLSDSVDDILVSLFNSSLLLVVNIFRPPVHSVADILYALDGLERD